MVENNLGYSVGLATGLDGGGVGGASDLGDLVVKVVDSLPLVVRIVDILVECDDVSRVRNQFEVRANTIPRLGRPDDGEQGNFDRFEAVSGEDGVVGGGGDFLDGGVGVQAKVFLVKLEGLPGDIPFASEGLGTALDVCFGTVVRFHDEFARPKDLARVLGLLGREGSGGLHLNGSELALGGHDNSCEWVV